MIRLFGGYRVSGYVNNSLGGIASTRFALVFIAFLIMLKCFIFNVFNNGAIKHDAFFVGARFSE